MIGGPQVWISTEVPLSPCTLLSLHQRLRVHGKPMLLQGTSRSVGICLWFLLGSCISLRCLPLFLFALTESSCCVWRWSIWCWVCNCSWSWVCLCWIFLILVASCEVFFDDGDELFSDIWFDCCVVWGVEPDDFAAVCVFARCWCCLVFDFFIVSAVFKCFVV